MILGRGVQGDKGAYRTAMPVQDLLACSRPWVPQPAELFARAHEDRVALFAARVSLFERYLSGICDRGSRQLCHREGAMRYSRWSAGLTPVKRAP